MSYSSIPCCMKSCTEVRMKMDTDPPSPTPSPLSATHNQKLQHLQCCPSSFAFLTLFHFQLCYASTLPGFQTCPSISFPTVGSKFTSPFLLSCVPDSAYTYHIFTILGLSPCLLSLKSVIVVITGVGWFCPLRTRTSLWWRCLNSPWGMTLSTELVWMKCWWRIPMPFCC